MALGDRETVPGTRLALSDCGVMMGLEGVTLSSGLGLDSASMATGNVSSLLGWLMLLGLVF